jgi:hypothetical protein
VVRTLGLDFVEVLDNLAAGLNNGGDDTGFPRLAGVVVGVAGAANSSGGNREFIDRPPNSNGRQDRGSLLLRAIL